MTAARPASDFDAIALLDVVAALARLVKPEHPERVAQRPWDRARALSVRYADAPPARRITELLGLSWSDVLRIALLAPGTRERTIGLKLGEDIQFWLTDDYVVVVLQLVAGRLGLATLSPAQYNAERARMLHEDAGRWRHGGHLRLPNDAQIRAVTGSWDRALGLAALAARPGRGSYARARPDSIVDIIERCYAHHGAQPFGVDVNAFAKANRIPVPRREAGRPWTDYIREWKDGRAAAGLPVPACPPPKAQRPDYSQDVGAAREGEHLIRSAWKSSEVADWVARYLTELSRGARVSKRGYDLWARDVDGAPWSSIFDKHGGWSAVLDTARRFAR